MRSRAPRLAPLPFEGGSHGVDSTYVRRSWELTLLHIARPSGNGLLLASGGCCDTLVAALNW